MPLSSETLAQIRENIKEAEAALKDMDAEIKKAMTAGIDVSKEIKDAEELKARIRQLKAVYGR